MDTGKEEKLPSVVVFDSGIGGLNLLRACVKLVPHARYYYVSDSANVPYGNRPPEEIMRLTTNALSGIERLNPAALVIACNTVTAVCIEELRKKYPFPVIGIQPAVRQAAKVGGKCLVLATEATVKSPAFKNLVNRFAPSAEVFGSRRLAAYVEENIFSLPETLPDGLLPDVEADSVVLGCTHYAFVKSRIEGRYHCPVFDGMEGTAARFRDVIGTEIHFCPQTGIFDHLGNEKLKITYLGENSERYAQIMKCLFRI